MSAASCVECDAQVTVEENALIGQITQCPECGAELEVVSTAPLRVELAPEVEEDWGE